jgi:hypothetical protein
VRSAHPPAPCARRPHAPSLPGNPSQRGKTSDRAAAPPLRQARIPGDQIIRLAPDDTNPASSTPQVPTTGPARHHDSPAVTYQGRPVRPWPLLILALPAAVAVWSGWVGIGQMTGFGQVHPLPGLWPGLHLNTAITLPIGVEAYAAYALRAWLTTSSTITARTRRFARRSAIGSLLLGMAGQVAYHLLTQAHITRAPWGITTAVSCLPVLVLGMGAALAHLLHADTHPTPAAPRPGQEPDRPDTPSKDHSSTAIRARRLAQAQAAAASITAAGQRVSRRNLRAAGIHASNAELGTLATNLKAHPPDHNPAPPPTPARIAGWRCQRQSRSVSPQSSAIRPSSIRMISMIVGSWPVTDAATPCTVVRTASLSPSASMSSTVTCRSGYFVRIAAQAFLTASVPRVPIGWLWKSGAKMSSTALVFPVLAAWYMRRASAFIAFVVTVPPCRTVGKCGPSYLPNGR